MGFLFNIWPYTRFLILFFFAFINFLFFSFYSVTNYLFEQIYFLKCILKKRTVQNRVEVLHCSKYFLVVNKPYDMVINSNDPKVTSTLQLKLGKMFPNLVNPSLRHEFYFVHRLDYATSGVICIALNKQSAQAASNAFEKRKVKKYYLALVHGHIHKSHMIISKPIGHDVREMSESRKMCTSDSSFCLKPRDSSTGVLVLELGFFDNKPATKVLLYPKTGRRHQLRVHCLCIGHTIIGDYTYSGKQDTEPHRTFLHALRIILFTDVENLDVKTTDPFDTSIAQNKWKPSKIIRTLDESAFTDISELVQSDLI